MRILIVLCVIGLAGTALAMPGAIRDRMSREFRNVKNGGVSKRPLNPLFVSRNHLSKSMKSGLHQKDMVCELCPPPSDIEPCTCECECEEPGCLADIICISDNLTRDELKRILSLPNYPVQDYSRLLIYNTSLSGDISDHLLDTSLRFKEIDFNHNGFTTIGTEAFKKIGVALRRLILNNNMIYDMGEMLLKDMPNIQYIDISHNMLYFIPNYDTENEHLSFLNISNNDLRNVGPYAFRGLSKLAQLDLSHNTFTRLDSNTFVFGNHEDLPLLLNLAHNQIATVNSNAIGGVKRIKVDLRDNKLKTLSEEVFRNFIDSTDASIHIDITGNPIGCDCFLLWVVQNSTVADCFDDFVVCDTTLKYVTTENLGDCDQNKTTTYLSR